MVGNGFQLVSGNAHHHSVRQVLLYFSFHRWSNGGLVTLANLPKVMLLVSGAARIHMRRSASPSLSSQPLHYPVCWSFVPSIRLQVLDFNLKIQRLQLNKCIRSRIIFHDHNKRSAWAEFIIPANKVIWLSKGKSTQNKNKTNQKSPKKQTTLAPQFPPN